MNSIENQSSGDSSHLYMNYHLTNTTKEGMPIFYLEPGTSLANTIDEHKSNEIIQPVSSILSHTESNNDSERQSLNESDNLKYKTELCRNFSTYGLCSYSSRCQFAHGLEELRCRTRHPKYKTEFCRNFLSGYCKYGSRCQFLHNLDDSKDALSSNESSTIVYPTAATIGAYLLTNMLAQSTTFGLGESVVQQSALATLTNYHMKSNPSLLTSTYLPNESSFRRIPIPLNCGIEMQQNPHLYLSPNIFHGISIPQNQNNNNEYQLSTSYLHNQTFDHNTK
ncbi:unnamed protein product [Adineta steineri]|uniref:C3H1-type domain-containing protein n=1 Tax=Adineta steineri TaxID=433720 RepID=A0A814UG69_9BILA|nr:unnamed protein product [Adineta steineri]CAF1174139.1 unnamed protein product [Adineta steineri]